MKTLILWMLVLSIASVSNAQNVNIPDTEFLYALIEEGVDINGDSLISYAEAEAVTLLDVGVMGWCSHAGACTPPGNISDLTGIEAFINLNSLVIYRNKIYSIDLSMNNDLYYLDCGSNNLTSLYLSKNTALTHLSCANNQLTSLDVSNNLALEYLYCSGNQLTSLDVFNNTALKDLYCDDNQLTSLDVSNNSALKGLFCIVNQLTSLDVSNNSALKYLYLSNMPSLYEVCVWGSFPAGVEVDTEGSPNVDFTTDCTVNIQDDFNENSTIDIYPNPSDDIINIEIENINNATIEIYNVSGRLVFSKVLDSKVERIDIAGFPKGVYFVKVKQDRSLNVVKVVVR